MATKKTSNNLWWVPSPTQYYYGSDKYYLPEKVIDVFGAETAIVYDKYNLLPIKTIVKATATSNYETTAEYDYQLLSPVKLTDHNDNVSEVILNPLGVVIAASIYGRENGEEKGDKPLLEYQVRKNPNFEDVLGTAEGANGPGHYLQNATSFFYYDLEAWRKNGQPVHVINLQRETHVSEGASTRIRRVVTHIDGFGRNLETKMLVDSDSKQWLASGRVVYNNKGTEVKKYEPFYSNSPFYDAEESVRNQGVSDTLYYDPLLRNIRIDTAKGFFSKVEFDSWTTKNFDLNDTVKDSTYYKEFTEKWNKASSEEKTALKDEKDSLSKAEKHYNTPTIEHLDSLRRKFLQIDILSKNGQSNVELKSHVKLDIQGNERESVDSRFYEQNQGKEEKIKNFIHTYSMAGLLKSTSIDAGETWSLANVAGSSVYNWDGKGSLTYTEYDKLQRPVRVKATDNDLNLNGNVVERFFYSENTQDKATNRYGTLIAHYDQAGLTEIKENDFKGQVLKSSYHLRKKYKQEADWKGVESITTTHSDLEREVFNSSIKYNAIGQIIEKTDSQNNTHSPIYDIAGRVKQIKLKKRGETINKEYVSGISYNPKGQRTSVTYGNGVVTSYSYDPKTFQLTKLESKKGQKKLQNIHYTYDPIGNITTMEDESYKIIFPNNKSIDNKSDYHYDSLYRLTQAIGKEHPALSGKEEIITPIPHLNNQNAISNYTEYYDFDYGSNITKIRHNGKNSSTKEFYISNKSNRSLPIIDKRPVNENDIDKNYDESGNLLKLNGSQDFHWNYRDNIAYVDIITRPSGKNDSEYYVYDSSGQRVRKVTETYQNDEAHSTKVDKIYFGDIEVTRTYQESDLKKEKYTVHVMDDKSRVALHHYWTKGTSDETRENQDRYQLSNHLDSAALELNDNAEIMTYEEYLPFGGTALIAGKTAREVTEKEYRYSGKEKDNSTGLYYYGARYYAPCLSRWINPDPAGTVDGLNLYRFVRGNPVIYRDKHGNVANESELRKLKKGKLLATGDGRYVKGAINLPRPSAIYSEFQSMDEMSLDNALTEDNFKQYIFTSGLLTRPEYKGSNLLKEGKSQVFNFAIGKVDTGYDEEGKDKFYTLKIGEKETNKAYWLPQGGYVDIDREPFIDDDPHYVFTPDFSGCSLTVNVIDVDKLRVRHVEGNKEDAQFNQLPVKERGSETTHVMEYKDYGYYKNDRGNLVENVTGFAYMKYDIINLRWVLSYQKQLNPQRITQYHEKEQHLIFTQVKSSEFSVVGTEQAFIPHNYNEVIASIVRKSTRQTG
ncbi:RHS repeat domain-containing protein [Wolbachia endosymbiont (group B) of Phalera bucephala]|uniref:RHS repeat domain-containing protein n=1 Tax=Wolbachia endosymbiont (group B) of Phalera bucephala TaxID=2954043 RepID=UPI002231A578|nr:RHS repeat-associated core domain-containing protein [Wolbachia endosymbiont (group B) of Phalera bucephala]